MPNSLTFDQHAVFTKITGMLSADPSPPDSMFRMGFWLARKLSDEELTLLESVEKTHGAEDANKLLCEAMSRSGKYEWDRETDEVELSCPPVDKHVQKVKRVTYIATTVLGFVVASIWGAIYGSTR
jgi:hypothetical protein